MPVPHPVRSRRERSRHPKPNHHVQRKHRSNQIHASSPEERRLHPRSQSHQATRPRIRTRIQRTHKTDTDLALVLLPLPQHPSEKTIPLRKAAHTFRATGPITYPEMVHGG